MAPGCPGPNDIVRLSVLVPDERSASVSFRFVYDLARLIDYPLAD